MSVEEAFRQWYEKLSSNDQQALFSYIRQSWFSGSFHQQVQPGFSGISVYSISDSVKMSTKSVEITCRNCGFKWQESRI